MGLPVLENSEYVKELMIAPYRGAIQFGSFGWDSIVNKLLTYSYYEYELTDRFMTETIQFYKGVSVRSMLLDRGHGGIVLKSALISKLEDMSGLSKNDPRFIRAFSKVPNFIGVPFLFEEPELPSLDGKTHGIKKGMVKLVSRGFTKVCHLTDCSGFRFGKYDGDLWVDFDNRIIQWESERALYPLHKDLIDFVTGEVDRHFFSGSFGGVIHTPDGESSYGHGRDVSLDAGQSFLIGKEGHTGINGLYFYRREQ